MVVKMIRSTILSDLNNTICTKQILRKCQITNPLSNQTYWDRNRTTQFQFQNRSQETTYSKGNASPTAYKFWRDQALRLLCLKGHVRSRGSTLWRHCWQEVNEFWCTKTPLFEGIEQPQMSPKKPWSTPSNVLQMSRFQNFTADVARKNRVPPDLWNRALHGFDWFELPLSQTFWDVGFSPDDI